jgi:hypothetical protein
MKNKNGLTLHARAKINLYLHVGPRRADGYHSIDTLFQEISLHDTLTFRLAPARISLRVTGGKLSAGPDNLVVRALEMLRQTLSVKAGMRQQVFQRLQGPHARFAERVHPQAAQFGHVRAAAEQLALRPRAPERDVRRAQAVEVERVHAFGRRDLVHAPQVLGQQRALGRRQTRLQLVQE